MHPFADTFVDKKFYNNRLPIYNLSCAICNNCKHVQTTTITPDSDRYNLFDYSYTSSNSSASRSHWDKFAEEVAKFTHCLKGRFVETVFKKRLRCFGS